MAAPPPSVLFQPGDKLKLLQKLAHRHLQHIRDAEQGVQRDAFYNGTVVGLYLTDERPALADPLGKLLLRVAFTLSIVSDAQPQEPVALSVFLVQYAHPDIILP